MVSADRLGIAEVKQEIERLFDLYQDAYPKLVEAGKLEQAEADRRQDLLGACLIILEAADRFGAAEVQSALKRMS